MLETNFSSTVDAEGNLLDTDDSFGEIAWNNIRVGAKHQNVGIVSTACMGWLRANPENRLADLENRLREEDVPVHLIANPKYMRETNGQKFGLRRIFTDSEQPESELLYSCRPDKYALRELKSHWDSYEKNLEALDRSGILCVREGDVSTEELPPQLETTEEIRKKALSFVKNDDHINALGHNYCRVKVEPISQKSLEDRLEADITRAKGVTGKEPECRTIGMTSDGEGIMAYVAGNQPVSNLGRLVGSDKSKVILINEQATWQW